MLNAYLRRHIGGGAGQNPVNQQRNVPVSGITKKNNGNSSLQVQSSTNPKNVYNIKNTQPFNQLIKTTTKTYP